MLLRLKVRNFKNFKEEIVLDFSNTKEEYDFNHDAIRNGIIKNAIIFGENAAGKTNIGYAIFDIVLHLTERNRKASAYRHYSNLYTDDNRVYFEYTFKLSDSILVYEYVKNSSTQVLEERIIIDGKEVIVNQGRKRMVNLRGAESLNLDFWDNSISFVKYIYSNTILDKQDKMCKAFLEFFHFVLNMIWFSSTEGNNYMGFSNQHGSICECILEVADVKEYQGFLGNMGIEYDLTVKDEGDTQNIYSVYQDKEVPLEQIWSSGTRALSFMFLWYIQVQKMSFVFIDEFDAFYHHELAENIVQMMIKTEAQVVLTSHNTDLMSNDLLRPDCYFELKKDKICSLADETSKALRRAHNLQKMYKAGAFNERT